MTLALFVLLSQPVANLDQKSLAKAGEPTRSYAFLQFGPTPAESNAGAEWVGESSATLHLDETNSSASLWMIRKLMPKDIVDHVLAFARTANYKVDDQDSVDGLPTYEVYLIENGTWNAFALQLGIQDWINTKVLTYIRSRYKCLDCVVCEALLRSYRPQQRLQHPLHHDFHAFVTVVVGLNAGDFSGGLYVQSNSSVASRQYINLNRGDVVFHQYGLRHGVQIHEGSRFSFIIWAKSSATACTEKSTPWYFPLAHSGDADAQYNAGNVRREGQAGFPKDFLEAARWYKRAAKQGHTGALRALGKAYLRGEGLEKDEKKARSALKRAAERGDPGASFDLGIYYLMQKRDVFKAEPHFLVAASFGNLKAMVNLAWLYEGGGGFTPAKIDEAERWYREAINMGDVVAKRKLDNLLRRNGLAKERSQQRNEL